MNAYVVRVPFMRLDPVTGQVKHYQKGDIIAHPDAVFDLAGSHHEPHANAVHLPEDHQARAEALAAVGLTTTKAEPAKAVAPFDVFSHHEE